MARSIHIDLLGTETRFVNGERYTTRIIEVLNDKPPLILLHGGGGHAETYSRNLNSLSATTRPIAMDFLWHGMSSRPEFSDGGPKDQVHWLRQFTLQVLDLMDASSLRLWRVNRLGMGGPYLYKFPRKGRRHVLNTARGIGWTLRTLRRGRQILRPCERLLSLH